MHPRTAGADGWHRAILRRGGSPSPLDEVGSTVVELVVGSPWSGAGRRTTMISGWYSRGRHIDEQVVGSCAGSAGRLRRVAPAS